MKTKLITLSILTISVIFLFTAAYRCSGTKKTPEEATPELIRTNVNGTGISIQLDFEKGEEHNYPLMAIWVEDMDGKYIETLYISESIGKGVFQHGSKSKGQWEPGPARRPAALPYWGHQRGIKADDGYYLPTADQPMPDAVTGPTPAGNFTLQSKSTGPLPGTFRILLEINQSWDWNDFWTNNKYPDDINYKTSSQPSLVYEAVIDTRASAKEFPMKPIGHGHFSGLDGSLDKDLSTITTALEITKSIIIKID